MIEQLRLRRFKCFQELNLAFGSLTLLTGLNGVGKSSVMQSLLLLRQSYLKGMLPSNGLLLNGPLVSLGTAKDVLFEGANEDTIELSTTMSSNRCDWQFSYKDPADDVILLVNGPDQSVAQLELFSRNFHYVSAERIGPREIHRTSSYEVDTWHQLGANGEYTAAYLDRFGPNECLEPLLHPVAVDRSAKAQVVAWLGEIAPGTQLKTRPYPELNRLSLKFEFAADRVTTREFNAPNVGFGISYVLPIVAALIASPVGTTVLLENPEAHLHPKAQAAMGRLAALAASAGIQVIVETHSDHFLNGVRIAAKRKMVDATNVAIHYFDKRIVNGTFDHFIHPLALHSDGGIDSWPQGFFDEWENSLDQLID